ncbi:MAG: hypothetical protein ACTSYI_03910 [Promethearchaeota archaeon]
MENCIINARCTMNICESLGIIIVQSAITDEFNTQSSNSKVMQNTLCITYADITRI